ncbi:MAG: hemolysin family protein [Microbacteriaceae bacterium]|nr:hemolysin family protein [Microbacteriaceae bacterium]
MSPSLIALSVAAIVLLLVLAGMFAATESALNVRSRAELYKLAEQGKRYRRAIARIADDEPTHLGAITFARVIAQSLAAALITIIFAYNIHSVWLALALSTAVLLVVTFLLVGSSPRMLGLTYPNAVICATAGAVVVVRFMLGPIAAILPRFSSAVALYRRNSDASQQVETQLLSLVDRAAEHDALEEDNRRYIHSVLEFGERRVRELMSPRTEMVTIGHDESMQAALEQLLASRHSRLPVITDDADDVVGVIHLRDAAGFVMRYPDEADTAPVTRMMREPIFVPDLMRADDLLQQMQREHNHLALAVDEYGGTSGLVTMEDLIEELVGDIHDEHDRELPDVQETGDGEFVINPRLSVAELGELFELELDDEDVDSAGGLVVKQLDRLAEEDDTVIVAGISLRVTRVDRRNKILELRASWVGGDAEIFEAVVEENELNAEQVLEADK